MIEIDWKAEAVKELRNYKFNVQGVKNLRERIEILDAQLEGIRSPGSTEGAGSGRERDETYCDVITSGTICAGGLISSSVRYSS